MRISSLRTRRVVGVASVGLLIGALAACGGSGEAEPTTEVPPVADDGDATATWEGVDDGTTLTLWTRAATEIQATNLVEAYNASHENQIALTVIPTDDFQTKVGAAAGAGDLPDLFSADIAYAPNYTSEGLFADITDRIANLPFANDIAQGHIEAGSWDGRQYVLPFNQDISVLMWNKDLYAQAGLDPEAGPTSLGELADHARAVSALGLAGVSGTYFGGNCGGCLGFTWWPSIWAEGAEVMNPEGTESYLDSEVALEVYSIYADLVAEGVTGAGTQDETGATWTAPFLEGKTAVMPYPATMLQAALDAGIDVGVAPIPGLTPGTGSTFVGGDGIGISAGSEVTDQAWNFLAWMLSDEAQLQIVAGNNDIVSRTDLAEGAYSDERVRTIAEVAAVGRTPIALNFGSAFNDPTTSKWIPLFRDAVFGDGSNVTTLNAELTAALQR